MRKKQQHRSDVMLRHIGDAFRNRRVELLISQDELAALSFVHRTYITDIESGYRNISLLTLEKLTVALKCALSFPLVDAERSMADEIGRRILDRPGSEGELLPRNRKVFQHHLRDMALETTVMANMATLQVSIEKYATKHGGLYPTNKAELGAALVNTYPVNPGTKAPELPTLGTLKDELRAMKTPPGRLRTGSIEYSPVGHGMNYILRGGAADGTALAGRIPQTTYILSGNFCSDSQP